MDEELLRRIDRLESLDEIRQLPAKYSLSLDMRDLDAHVGLFADGVAVATVGKEPFRIIRQTVDEVITASTDEMCAAIKDIFEDTK